MAEIYQDVWQRGQVVTAGIRECASRWAPIEKLLKQFKRPFTLLDIGANLGYFGIRAAERFDCVSVMIDYDERLIEQCKANFTARGLIALHHELTLDSLRDLAECECFDVVLALSVCHHFGADSEAVAEIVLKMGRFAFVETPHRFDRGACGQAAIEPLFWKFSNDLRLRKVGETPSHTDMDHPRPMWFMDGSYWRQLRHRSAIGVESDSGGYERLSDFNHAEVRFERKGERREWVNGINLQTWLRMGGKWPTKEMVLEMLRCVQLPAQRHGDVRPWNFVLDGDAVHLIDGGDERANFDDADGLALTIAEVEACAP